MSRLWVCGLLWLFMCCHLCCWATPDHWLLSLLIYIGSMFDHSLSDRCYAHSLFFVQSLLSPVPTRLWILPAVVALFSLDFCLGFLHPWIPSSFAYCSPCAAGDLHRHSRHSYSGYTGFMFFLLISLCTCKWNLSHLPWHF